MVVIHEVLAVFLQRFRHGPVGIEKDIGRALPLFGKVIPAEPDILAAERVMLLCNLYGLADQSFRRRVRQNAGTPVSVELFLHPCRVKRTDAGELDGFVADVCDPLHGFRKSFRVLAKVPEREKLCTDLHTVTSIKIMFIIVSGAHPPPL